MQSPEDQIDDASEPAAMGPLPATPGCRCRICRPDPQYDEHETRAIANVLQHGWHVILVGAGPAPEEPAFAYTVGLGHRSDHPELLISGLPTDLMHRVLNGVAQRVLNGRHLAAGDAIEGALAHVPLLVDELNDAALAETVTWSRWFHRRPVEALQLIWPDTSARFAWQPDAPTVLNERQPPNWRKAHPRHGAFAPTPLWPWTVLVDTPAFVCTHITDDGEVIRFVARQPAKGRGEDWSFHCGGNHDDTGNEIAPRHLTHIVRTAPSLRELADLGLNEQAWRKDADHPWQRSTIGQP